MSQGTQGCCWQPPEAGKVKEGSSPPASVGRVVLPTPWFQISGLLNYEKIHFEREFNVYIHFKTCTK